MILRVKVSVNELAPKGEMFAIDGMTVERGFSPAPFLDFISSMERPTKIIVVHDESDAHFVREAVEEADDMELIE